jgi:hypothetical protein
MKVKKENWESTRKKGFLYFFLFRGLLLFGLPFTLIQIFMKWQEGNKINFIALILSGIITGLIYSGSMWYFAEKKFKKENPTNKF